MTHITTFKGSPLELVGSPLSVGSMLPSFQLTGVNMEEITPSMFKGKKLIVLTAPSLDTPVCSMETKHFNQEVANLGKDVVVLFVSMDLPFAQKRWCGAEGVSVVTASDYKYRKFGEQTGAFIKDWGLFSRAVFVTDTQHKIVYVEYVSEVSQEPDYKAALAAA